MPSRNERGGTGRPEKPLIIDVGSGADPLMRVFSGEACRTLETEVLPGWLAARRWYAAKGASHPEVRIADMLPFPGEPDAALVLVKAIAQGEVPQIYLVPLALVRKDAGDGDGAVLAEIRSDVEHLRLVDALAEDGFVRDMADRMARGDGTRDARSGLRFQGLPGAEPADLLDGPVQRSGAEQSNTSARVGGAMLKVLRKLEPGIHPELEMTRHLSERTAFGNVPALIGSLERLDASGVPTAFCVLQALVSNKGDAWSWTLDCLARGAVDELGHLAERLGARTAELHRALTEPSDDPAFAPEPVDAARVAEWAEGVRMQAQLAIETLRKAAAEHQAQDKDAPKALLTRADALRERIDAWTPEHVEAERIRIHGDYHLGQVLVSDDDVFIIDFEGEPMRPLSERRAKHAPLKDVAGMLRSFDYAGAAAAEAAEDEDAATQARGLAAETAGIFHAQYLKAIEGCSAWPRRRDDAERLLRLFLLEKALYEIRYEAANRPEWLKTPVAATLALLDAPRTQSGVDPSPSAEDTSTRS